MFIPMVCAGGGIRGKHTCMENHVLIYSFVDEQKVHNEQKVSDEQKVCCFCWHHAQTEPRPGIHARWCQVPLI